MYEQKAQTVIDQAEKMFKNAHEELARPEEDVVPYSVCRNAFKSVNNYLSGYLLKHGIDIHASMSLDMLLNHCREIDPKFNELNLDPLYSSSEPEDVWMDMETVKEFIELASKTREMVGGA
jgi:HEPN domain-containing protein